jgi:four helix bundle protein
VLDAEQTFCLRFENCPCMTESGYQDFTALEVWQNARALRKEIYDLVKTFPGEEKFKLTDQLVRTVRSICSNIAEGHGRFTYRDQLHFCMQARGSLSETLNHLFDALDCGYISKEQIDNLSQKLKFCGKLLNGYITFLRSKL